MFGVTEGFDYIGEILIMEELNEEDKKAYVKQLWESNPVDYYKWKELCVELDQLPDFFGTHDNPIPIDESKL